MNKQFIVYIIVINILLWISYIYFLKNESNMIQSTLWNNIKKTDRMSLLLMASISYGLNILLSFYFAYSNNLNKQSIHIVLLSFISYYFLQIFFIPLLQSYTNKSTHKNIYKIMIQLLLIIVVIPMGIIMFYGIQTAVIEYKKNKYISIAILLCSIAPFLHVLINDAYIFGLNF